MANTLGQGYLAKEVWTKVLQTNLNKENVVLPLVNRSLEAQVANGGTTVHNPYAGRTAIADYTKGTAITIPDVSGTDESVEINVRKVVPFYIDSHDTIQVQYGLMSHFAYNEAIPQLKNTMEQAVLATYSGATKTLYKADIGESGASTAIALNSSNAYKPFSAARKVLEKADVRPMDMCALVGPEFATLLRETSSGRETGWGDKVLENGYLGPKFGFEVYQTNNLPFTATLTTSSAIGNNETVTINGCTFTFKDTLTGAAGEVYSGGNDADTTTQLAAAINACRTKTEGTGNTYRLPTDDNRWKIAKAGIVATDATTSITLVGYGDIVVSETMAQAANVWSVQKSYPIFMKRGAIDLIVQKEPSVEIKDASDKLGNNIFAWDLYVAKLWTRNKDLIVPVCIDASSWV